jgi:hypothetical protein
VGLRVAIAQVDGKWPNLALAKMVAHLKAKGDDVFWFSPLFCADRTYASKVFTDTPDDPYLPETTIRGGSGYSLRTTLPDDIERLKPDWSLWPWWKKDIGYSTRGCIRRCPFCNVREKDGDLRIVAEFADLTTGRSHLVLYDANIIAAPIAHFRTLCAEATAAGVTLDFSQGLDARLLTDEHAAIVARSLVSYTIHLAFDSVRDEPHVRRAVRILNDAGINTRNRALFFVLVGFDSTPEEDLYRVELLRDLGANPFVMPFNRSDRYQQQFARWANRPQLFRSCTWHEYKAGKL